MQGRESCNEYGMSLWFRVLVSRHDMITLGQQVQWHCWSCGQNQGLEFCTLFWTVLGRCLDCMYDVQRWCQQGAALQRE